jgi:hypothetical protein
MRTLASVFLCAVTLALALAGCSSVTSKHDPAVDLSHYHHFFVEHLLTDNHRIDEQIVAELHSLGLDASSGPMTMKPDDADAIVTYNDRWTEDFKKYLIDLHIDIRDARTDKPLTVGRYYQPSIITQQPSKMIHDILAPLFAPSGKTK